MYTCQILCCHQGPHVKQWEVEGTFSYQALLSTQIHLEWSPRGSWHCLTVQSHSVWRHVTTTCCSIIAFNSCFFQFSGWIIAGIPTCQLIKTESPESCKPKSSERRFDPRQLEISDLKKCKVFTPSTLGTLWEVSGNLCCSRVLPPCGRMAIGLLCDRRLSLPVLSCGFYSNSYTDHSGNNSFVVQNSVTGRNKSENLWINPSDGMLGD